MLTPLSVPLREIIYGIENDIILPTEPLIIMVLMIFLFKILYEKKFDVNVLKHPVTILIFFNLLWILLTSVTSVLPVVSFKFLISRIWFLVTFYFLAIQIFTKTRNIETYLWCFIVPLLGIITYALVRHYGYGFANQRAAHIVSRPFFNDHTAYGAILALVYPVVIYFFVKPGKELLYKIFSFILIAFFSFAIVLSYTRATWLSLVGSLCVVILIKYRIKLVYILSAVLILFVFLVISWQTILLKLEQNKTDSSKYLMDHVKSMSNVSTDASNLERINRWSCAIRMFKEKPVFGWGPGTYLFKYAPFQLSYQKTIISTNAGIMGNAHSEYIGPLAESGVPGSFTFILIVVFTIITAVRIYYRQEDVRTKELILAILAGLISYYIHGLMNNFLDTDKASCLFWGYTAIIVALDIKQKQNNS